ncbi:glycine oxidase ThiO [Aquibacillus salsiterrae]|uniref:glycine oxidase n=1 Tax=Aquibacillus salsiterrae TaxID=2950439 RepID=A0A9X4AFW1_9BACI|nr:glycine oxidase ThiO [Aquibacillus salsiterrae]MDC3418059.1 glycine oxidase ThiO [Aquibacillus salsiterrae]
MNNSYDAIVVGGGVNGGAIAYQLAKRGASVLLLEKGRIASKASGAAAGMLAAQAELEDDGPLFQLAKKSRAMFPKLAVEIKEASGIDIGLINKGMLKIALAEQDMKEYNKIISIQQACGEQAEWLTGEEVRKLEPNLSTSVMGAMHIENDGQVEAPQLTVGLLKSAARHGVVIKENVEVESVKSTNGMVTAVMTNEGEFISDQVIIAGGAWSNQLLSRTGLPLETYPVKGECFSVTTHQALLTKTIFSHECYLVPKKGSRIVVGATVKPHTFNEQVTVSGISQLMEKARNILPGIVEAEWEKAWAGIRPQTADGLPYLGAHPELKGIFVATGHFRNGILLAPITGEIIADLVEGKAPKVDVNPFRVDRLTKQLT